MVGKPRWPLRVVRTEPMDIAKSYLAGDLGPEALVDDAVYAAALDLALGKTRREVAAEMAQASQDYAQRAASRFGKGDEAMSIFGVDPQAVSQMSEEQLVMYSARVAEGIASTQSPLERQQYQEFGEHLRKAILNLAASKEAMAKAILTKKPDDAVDPAPPPDKHKGKTVNAKGDTAYSYDKPHGGKGPGKQPLSKKGPKNAPAAPPEAGDEQGPAITPPPPVDPKALADKLGVGVDTLKGVAEQNTREKFIAYFTAVPTLVKKYNLTVPYLSALYDALTTPPAPPPGKTPPGAPPPKSAAATGGPPPAAAAAPAMGKAILHFVGTSKHPQTQQLLKALKKHRVENVVQMQSVLKAHFALDDAQAVHLTRTLLRQWEADAVVNLTPA